MELRNDIYVTLNYFKDNDEGTLDDPYSVPKASHILLRGTINGVIQQNIIESMSSLQMPLIKVLHPSEVDTAVQAHKTLSTELTSNIFADLLF